MAQPQDPTYEAFERFTLQCKKNLERIARKTRGEFHVDDIVSEAWLVGQELRTRKDVVADFLDPSFQNLLLSHLYQRIVHFREKKIRNAVRLDQSIDGSERDSESHPLMYVLKSDEGRHPLAMLIEQEDARLEGTEIDAQHSLASAYIRLLSHFGNDMRAVSYHLRISTSYCYHQCAKARLLTLRQRHMPISPTDKNILPRPWRGFRLYRIPVQLAFDFDDELPFFDGRGIPLPER